MTSSNAVADTVLELADPITSPDWAQLVGQRPSTLFHSPDWMRVIQDTYDFPFFSLILKRGGKPVAGIPWCALSDFLGERCLTLPFSDFCDPLADTGEDAQVLLEEVARRGGHWNLRARAGHLPSAGLPPEHRSLARWQGIDLTQDLQTLWKRIDPKSRRAVHKSERSGVELRPATDKADLREWYLVHLRLRKYKHHLLAQPYAFFENIWDAFLEKGNGFLLLAVHQGQIIGGTLYLLWRDTCYYKFNASDHHYLTLRPNNLMVWQGIMEAKRRGCAVMDLGRSPHSQEGLISFKRNFGVFEEDILSVTYNGRPRGGAQQGYGGRQFLNELTQFFAHDTVPDSVTEEAGAVLYRYFA